eukprot:TRINITY_DN10618_c0_g1_i1.p4 TRINITY_DN10618_c0_g1~~TRINITY_DN10618_c0_g1_i1.p4  ORF type:complete len:125 (+),score=8.58 TRINITY_DN10618_c0_g1_i1:800-1174(+)
MRMATYINKGPLGIYFDDDPLPSQNTLFARFQQQGNRRQSVIQLQRLHDNGGFQNVHLQGASSTATGVEIFIGYLAWRHCDETAKLWISSNQRDSWLRNQLLVVSTLDIQLERVCFAEHGPPFH